MNSRVSTGLKGAVAVTLLAVLSAHPAIADTTVVPNQFTAIEGNNATGTPVGQDARTLQTIIDTTQITGLSANSSLISGLAFRLDRVQTGQNNPLPATNLTFADYEIYLGQAVGATNVTSDVFASNYAGGAGARTLVRDGALNIAAQSFPAGTVADFGPVITFDSPYLYQGGGLVIEIRHSGSTVFGFFLDADNTNTGFISRLATSNTATSATAPTSTPVTQLTFSVTAAPEPGTFALLTMGGLLGAAVIKRRRQV